MAKHQKTKRTQLNDLAVNEQELTAAEASKVRGGAALDAASKDAAKTPTALSTTLSDAGQNAQRKSGSIIACDSK